MNIGNLKTILYFVKDYKKYVLGILALSILYVVLEGVNIAVLFPVISSIIKTDAAAGPQNNIVGLLNFLIGMIPLKDTFIATCLFVVIVVAAKNIFRYLYMILSAYASYRIWDNTQKKLFDKYIRADYQYFLSHKQGEISYRLYTAPSAVGGVLNYIPQLTTEVLKIAVITVMLFSMSFSITLAIVVMAGVFYYLTRVASKKVSYSLGKGRVQACEEQNILINETINGIKQIKVFLGEKRWIAKFYAAMNQYFVLAKKDVLWINMPASALEIFALTGLCVFLIAARITHPQSLALNIPLLGVFAYAFQRLMPSLSSITTLRMQIMGSLPILEVVHDVINEKMTHIGDGDKRMDSFKERIEFDNVYFSYPGRPETLKGISVSFEKNKCAAIAGSSGSGKTTIVNLLIRLFDPARGAIRVDGIDLRDYKRDSWLSKVGFVSQDTFIFHASVRDNITFGVEGVSHDDVVKAASIANAHDFIQRLPHGYDTVVGERGMKLSGGEQQRIAIARAVLRNPQILIFDEATSALDNVSQALIQNSINKIVKDHTVILIAHRLSTIVNADKIIVLDKGEVRESGSHAELISKKGFYFRLYNNEESAFSYTPA